jgi:hypothetical protein
MAYTELLLTVLGCELLSCYMKMIVPQKGGIIEIPRKGWLTYGWLWLDNYRRAGWLSQHGQEYWSVVVYIYCSKTWTSDMDDWYELMSLSGMDEENTSWWLCKGLLYVEDCSRDDLPVDCARGNWPADDCARENGPVSTGWLNCGWLW